MGRVVGLWGSELGRRKWKQAFIRKRKGGENPTTENISVHEQTAQLIQKQLTAFLWWCCDLPFKLTNC